LRINPIGPKGKRLLLCVRGGVGFIALSCYYFSITKMTLGDAVVLSFTSPVFTAISAVFILKEKWERYDIIGAILSMVGVVLIARPGFLFGGAKEASDDNTRLFAVAIALFGAVMAGFAYVTVRKIGPSAHALVLVNYFSVLSLICSPIAMLILKDFVWPSDDCWLPIFGMGIAATIAQVMLNRGLQLEKAAKATTMNYLQIVFSFIWELLILNNLPNYFSIIGAGLIAGWAVIVLFKMWQSKG